MLSRIVKELTALKVVMAFLLAFIPILATSQGALAATTADITVNATPAYVSISVNTSSYNFGVVAASSTTNTSVAYFGITNTSSVQTDQTISTTTTTWSGTQGWLHNDSGIPGDNATAILSNNTTWGATDIIVKNAAPNFIRENLPASTSYSFGLGLWAPTVLYDDSEKTITVRVSAVQG